MVKDFFNKDFTYAVVGATINQDKYGYRVLKDLQAGGYKVVGVNPKYQEIEGLSCFAALADLPVGPKVLVFVVPPEVGLNMLPQAASLGFKKVWFQPGAESPAVRAKIKDLGLNGVADGSCIMVIRRTI
jgi:hypothetical protein